MYIGNNPSALRSQRLLATSMIKLMGIYSYDGISVTMLCQDSGVSRQTFYKVFGTKENIVRFVARKKCEGLETELSMLDVLTLEELALAAFFFFAENMHLIEQLAKNRLQYLLVDQAQLALLDLLEFYRCDDPEILDDSNRAFIAGGLIAMLMSWIECGKRPNVRNRAAKFAEMFSIKTFYKTK